MDEALMSLQMRVSPFITNALPLPLSNEVTGYKRFYMKPLTRKYVTMVALFKL
jgi:hypothetical protein